MQQIVHFIIVSFFLLIAHSHADDQMTLGVVASYTGAGCSFTSGMLEVDFGTVDVNEVLLQKSGNLTVSCVPGFQYKLATNLHRNASIITNSGQKLKLTLFIDDLLINCSQQLANNTWRITSQTNSAEHQRVSQGEDSWHYCVQIDNSLAETALINFNLSLIIEAL
jgi:hypothetical protein